MKRILFVAAIVCFGLSALAEDLEINATPINPVLIKGPVAPYFSVDSITGTWKGKTVITLARILFSTKDPDSKVSCVVDIKQMWSIFPNNHSQNGYVNIQPGQSFSSTGFLCDHLEIKDLTKKTYDIPVTIEMIGLTVINAYPVIFEAFTNIVVN